MSKGRTKECIYDEIHGGKGYQAKTGLVNPLYSRLRPFEQNRYQAVFKLLGRGGRLLDIGCGSGTFCLIVSDKFHEIHGIDVSSVNINNAQKNIADMRNKNSFRFIRHDADEGLPFPNDYFDAVTCIATLESLIDPPQAIMETLRVLKPGGVFIAQLSTFAFLPHRFTLLSGRLPTPYGLGKGGVDWTRLHNFTKQSIVSVLKMSKFDIVKVTCSGIFSHIRRIWSSLLGGDIVVRADKPKTVR